MTHRDPAVLIMLHLDTNLDVTGATAHVFDRQGDIIRTKVHNGDHDREPYTELSDLLWWSSDQLNDFFLDLDAPQAR